VAGVAVSSTYVSATNATAAENPGNVRTGGGVRAFVRCDKGPGSFAPLDEMPYPDSGLSRDELTPLTAANTVSPRTAPVFRPSACETFRWGTVCQAS
jgi:hypothetical protein